VEFMTGKLPHPRPPARVPKEARSACEEHRACTSASSTKCLFQGEIGFVGSWLGWKDYSAPRASPLRGRPPGVKATRPATRMTTAQRPGSSAQLTEPSGRYPSRRSSSLEPFKTDERFEPTVLSGTLVTLHSGPLCQDSCRLSVLLSISPSRGVVTT
jgi:hypothetical protein